MTKSLIINADDFGFDHEATSGILELLSQRKISSTTVMANYVNTKDLKALQKLSGIGVGMHVNLIEGYPVCSPSKIPNLLNKKGEFLGAKNLLIQTLLHKIPIEQIYLEIEAQLNLLVSNGIQVTHADSHQHLHQFPILGNMIQKAWLGLKITKVRNSFPLATDLGVRPFVLKAFTKLTPISKRDFTSPEGLLSNMSFGKNLTIEHFTKAIISTFKNHTCLEMMTHPAIKDRKGSYLKRKQEYEFWLEQPIQDLLKMNQIEMIHFGNL